MWQWTLDPQQQQQQPASSVTKQQQQQQQAGCLSSPAQQLQQQGCGFCAGLELLHATDWPQPVQVATLTGHTMGVWQVEFSHAGDMLATSSLDGGTVMVSAVLQCFVLSPQRANAPFSVDPQPPL
jgi:WD40 repeat protein